MVLQELYSRKRGLSLENEECRNDIPLVSEGWHAKRDGVSTLHSPRVEGWHAKRDGVSTSTTLGMHFIHQDFAEIMISH